MCQNGPVWSGGAVAGPHVVKLRDEIETTSDVAIKSYAFNVPFGLTQGNLTLARLDNCTRVRTFNHPHYIIRLCPQFTFEFNHTLLYTDHHCV